MESDVERQPDPAARRAGLLLIVTAAATVVAVVGRVAADADHSTLAASLVAISESKALYGTGGAARLVSGVTLIAGAWFLLRTWIIRERLGTPLVPLLFMASGLLTAVSGAGAVALTALAPDVGPTAETVAALRELTGKAGFAAAGLALIVAARYQWRVGGILRRIAPITVIIGIALQLIWFDPVIMVHTVSGAALLAWLVLIGGMLCTGRTERHFVALLDSAARER